MPGSWERDSAVPMRALKIGAVLAFAYLACAGLGVVVGLATVVSTETAGAAPTGDAMMTALAAMGAVDLLSLPAVFLALRRWLKPALARLLFAGGLGILLAATWLFFAFSLAVVLNR